MDLENEIRKVFPEIANYFNSKDLLKFKGTLQKNLFAYHYGLGTWIRSYLLLGTGKLYQSFLQEGIGDKDEMSAILIKKYHAYVTKTCPTQ